MTSSEIQHILYSMCVTRGEREAVRLCNVKTSYCIPGKKVIKSVENVKNPNIQLLSKVCLQLLSQGDRRIIQLIFRFINLFCVTTRTGLRAFMFKKLIGDTHFGSCLFQAVYFAIFISFHFFLIFSSFPGDVDEPHCWPISFDKLFHFVLIL